MKNPKKATHATVLPMLNDHSTLSPTFSAPFSSASAYFEYKCEITGTLAMIVAIEKLK
jgi:hypothetical protein